MPKLPTFPILYDNVLQISISKLKEWGYLDPDNLKSGILNWNINGNPTGCISIYVSTLDERPYIELDYKYNDEPRNYQVELVSIPSNLGKGKIWYFLCPRTNKRCRKLYSIDGYFLHREAFKGCFYDCQTKSKYYRKLNKTLGAYFKVDQVYDEIYSKNFKTHYAGKETKKYKKLRDIITQAENIDLESVNDLFGINADADSIIIKN
jgi:hypothetical protein